MSKILLSILGIFIFWAIAVGQQMQAPKLRPIQQDGKWGYIDTTGKVVIKPQFYWAEEFSEGLAAFENDDGLYGYIDETGKVVIEPILERWSPFSEGLAAAAIKNMEWGYIDKTGKWVIKPQFFYAHPFKDGFAAVDVAVEKDGVILMGEKTSTMIDRTGQIMFKPVPYVLNARVSNEVAFFQHVSKSPVGGVSPSLLIDRRGKVIFEGEDIELDGFSEGLAPVKKGGKWGYVDTTGKFVIQPRFNYAKSFSEGLAAVNIGEGKWGYIDRSGKFVIPAKFGIDELGSDGHLFSEGLALVYSGEDPVFIDKQGNTVLKPNFTDVERFVGGLAAVKNKHESGEEWRGYIDKKGKFVWGLTPFKYKTTADLRAQIKKREEKEGTGEKLTPLSDDEKKLNYRDKTYDDLEGVDNEALGTGSDFNPKLLAAEAESVFRPLGKIAIDGHECIKIAVERKGAAAREEELYLYSAKDLRNLIIVAQMRDSGSTLVQRLQSINLAVPDTLVQIPPDYAPVERDIWKKVENAKVKYDGKESRDFGVFRSPSGQLFVWIKDAKYPWKYLLHPKEKLVETAYQGLLVTRKGEFIWQTKETQALSLTYYRKHEYIERQRKDSKLLEVSSGSLKFQSNDSKDIWIEVTMP
jgi:hypothetical protein